MEEKLTPDETPADETPFTKVVDSEPLQKRTGEDDEEELGPKRTGETPLRK